MTGSCSISDCFSSANNLLHLFSDLLAFLQQAGALSSFSLNLSAYEGGSSHGDTLLDFTQRGKLKELLANLRTAAENWEIGVPNTTFICVTPDVLETANDLPETLPEFPELYSEPENEETEINKPKSVGFECHLCGRIFNSKAHLRRHVATHDGTRKHECSECGKRYAAKHGVVSHLLREHGKGPAFSCGDCGKQFALRQELEKHSAVHAKTKPFSCDICERTFSQKVTRDAHLALHTGVFPYECEICGKRFALQAKLRAHALVHGPPKFECDICGRKFTRNDCLRQHIKRHSDVKPWQCSSCGRSFRSSYALNSHAQVHLEGARYVCETCGARFRQKSSLILHLKRHSKSGLHSCAHCNKSYVKKYDLDRHTLSHAKERDFLCEACGKDFRSAGDLAEHRRRSHSEGEKKLPRPRARTENKEFACTRCPKIFKTRSRLSTHNRQCHSELQPRYECGTCGKRFHRSDVLRNHERVHSGERPFSCEHCSKTFASRTNLVAHSLVHKPPAEAEFQCGSCPRAYRRAASLAAHHRKHHEQHTVAAPGNEQLSCPVCQRTFPSKSALGGHLRSHPNEERPFACVLCNRKYKKRKHWREHVQKSHSDLTDLGAQLESTLSQPEPPFGLVPEDALQLLEQLTEPNQNYMQNQTYMLEPSAADNPLQGLEPPGPLSGLAQGSDNHLELSSQLQAMDSAANHLGHLEANQSLLLLLSDTHPSEQTHNALMQGLF